MAVSQAIQEQMLKEAYSVTPNYDIDYKDPRFTQVESDKKDAINDLNLTYSDMIASSDKYFQDQIDELEKWGDKQTDLQNQKTDFAIEQINQQKEQAQKDYLKEQSGAYVDWQKQSNKYGVNAEQMASAGLAGSGFSESSQVSMYNTYQNRVAVARESIERAKLNYDMAIKDAMLQNSAALAEIAYTTLQQSLELSLQGFQYKNQLLLEQANKKIEIDNMYYNRYQDVLQQINTENAIKEDIRQYNETQKWNTEQAEKNREHDKTMAEVEYNYQVKRDEATREFEAAQAELDRQHEIDVIGAKTDAEKAVLDKEWEIEQKRLAAEHANALDKIEKEREAQEKLLAYQKSLSGYGTVSGGNKAVTGKSTLTSKYNTKKTNVVATPQVVKPKSSGFTGSTHEQAVAYLKSKGVSSAGVLTASEWSRRKSSYSMTGIGNAAVKNYSSYSAYLRDYVNYTASSK